MAHVAPLSRAKLAEFEPVFRIAEAVMGFVPNSLPTEGAAPGAMIAAFGFLNRWNATLATELEGEPLAFASAHLTRSGWQAGEHGRGRPGAPPSRSL